MAVNKVQLANGTVLMDSSGVTVTAGDMLTGVTAMSSSGAVVTGSLGDFGGATSQANGTHGLVPAPLQGDEEKFLCGDGSWTALTLATDSEIDALFSSSS